ncbi:aluminum induced protein [Artemisia annua]|uniref:Aluminum induced protein n=1 Tax=Artemisia annua TaxID=35608 RepID=A0A2U1PNG6_ARTAN|nr:aluminum induced protein [Artemisia annua]
MDEYSRGIMNRDKYIEMVKSLASCRCVAGRFQKKLKGDHDMESGYGCMFHSEDGLMSFEHPMNKIKAMPRVDSEGVMCGANFKVDTYSRVNSIPRRGSEANWTQWVDNC